MKSSRKFIVFALCSLLFVQVKAQELLNYPLDTINGEEVYRYEVERGIGLYRIGVNFEVPQSDLIRLNPQLRERGLHYGETILIPTKRPAVVVVETKRPQVEETKQEELEKNPVVVVEARPEIRKPEDTVLVADSIGEIEARIVELALMLPFESQQTKRSSNADRMMEFYEGVLFALRELQNDSVHYRLRVYDTERSERRVMALVDSTELDSVQAILGLAYPIQIERMAIWCDSHGVPLLLPFSNETDVEANPQLLQFNSTDKQEADSLCLWMKKQNARFWAVEVQDAEMAESVRILRKQMKVHGISYLALTLKELMSDSAGYVLDPEKENIILLHSDKYQHVRILLPHIAKLQEKGYKIRIVSRYSWQKEEINLPQVFTSMFTANRSCETFDSQRDLYFPGEHVSETPRYDLLGYDLTNALVAWLQGKKTSKGLQSDIHWEKVGNGGWQNGNVKVVVK